MYTPAKKGSSLHQQSAAMSSRVFWVLHGLWRPCVIRLDPFSGSGVHMAQAVTRNFGGSWGIPPPLRFRQPRRSPTLAGFRVVWGSGFRGSPHFQSVGFDCVAKKQAHASPPYCLAKK